MIVKTLPKVSRIGMNIEDLYEYYINGVLEREDWGQLLVNERWNFCMNLAWLNLRTGTPDLDKKHIKTAAKSIRKNVHLKKLIRILKNTTLLTQRKTPSHGFQFSFIHSSFNDYLVARFLKMVFLEKIKFHYEDFDLDFLNNYISPETIVFLKNMVREKDIKKIVALKKMKKPQDVNIKKMSKIVGFFLTQIKFIDIIKSSVLLDLKYYPAPDKYIHKISNSLVERWSIKRKEIEKRLIKREKDSNIMIRPGFSLISFNIKGKKIFDIILVRAKRGALFITDSDPIRSAFIIVSTQDERLMYLHSIMWIAQIADDIDFESEWKEAKDEDKLRDIIISSFKKHYKFL